MAADTPIPYASCRTLVVAFLLCSSLASFNCFPQRTLGKILPWQLASEKLGIRKGKILFSGKELNSLSQSDGSEIHEQDSHFDQLTQVEAAWRRTHPSLQCGPTKMILKVTGRGAANLDLDLGSGRSLPLNQLPESCGHLLNQNSLSLVFVVWYGGCNVIQANGYRMLPLIFLETSVTLACPMFPALTPQHPIPQFGPNAERSKRGAAEPSANDPYKQYQHYHNYLKYLYFLHTLHNPQIYAGYNPMYPTPHLVSHLYPHLPMYYYPLYTLQQQQQNPAAPYCHPPGALCPFPHYILYPRHQSQARMTSKGPEEVTAIPTIPSLGSKTTTAKPSELLTTPATATTTTKRPCRRRTQSPNINFTPYYWQEEPWFSQEHNEGIPLDWDDI
nr:uncharacterized protein LOC125984761 isoform X2 [Syngnathus scovelli]